MEYHPYIKCRYRLDRVVRVPSWAKTYISKGDIVIRQSKDTVLIHKSKTNATGGFLQLGESYTKFMGYTDET